MDTTLSVMIERYGAGRLGYDAHRSVLEHLAPDGSRRAHPVEPLALCALLQLLLLGAPGPEVPGLRGEAQAVAALLAHLDRMVASGVEDLGEQVVRAHIAPLRGEGDDQAWGDLVMPIDLIV